jgi:23S rRNA pseudouridine1911/1915/1917 synthase
MINGAAARRVAWRVAAGDEVRVRLEAATPRSRPAPEPEALEILYEDDHLLIVNKPAGVVSHPSFGHASGTLLNAVLWHAAQQDQESAPALLTRLDKFTSGAVLVAKRPAVFTALQRAMRTHQIEKDYLAIVHGKPVPARGTIDAALDRDPWDRRRVAVTDRGGQPAVTRYERLAVSTAAGAALVKCRLITGRMHQIRVHLSSKGWPVVGDAAYGSRAHRTASDPARIGFPRQALHAWRVALTHPVTRRDLVVTAPLPDDMAALAARLGLEAGELH